MHSLSEDTPGLDSLQTNVDRMMLGTSPGIKGDHNVKVMPYGALTYLLRAELARVEGGVLRENATMLALDSRCPQDALRPGPNDQGDILQRTDRLRELTTMLTGYTFVTRSDIEPQVQARLAQQGKRLRRPSEVENPLFGEYLEIQTAVVEETLRIPEEGKWGGRRIKVGWVTRFSAQGKPIGGEVNFDEYLLWGVEPHYVLPDFVLGTTRACAPYLLKHGEEDSRIIIPASTVDIPRELEKISSRLTIINAHDLRTTAQVLCGDVPLTHVDRSQVPWKPSAWDKKLPEAEVAPLRTLVGAALERVIRGVVNIVK